MTFDAGQPTSPDALPAAASRRFRSDDIPAEPARRGARRGGRRVGARRGARTPAAASCTSGRDPGPGRLLIQLRTLARRRARDPPALRRPRRHRRGALLTPWPTSPSPDSPPASTRPAIVEPAHGDRAPGPDARRSYARSTCRPQATGAEGRQDEARRAQVGRRRAARRLDVEGGADASSPPTPRAWRVTRTGGAPIGGYSVRVTQLASSAQKTYTLDGSTTAPRRSRSTTATPRPTRSRSTIGADAKIADVAAAINGRSGAPVYAAVVGGDKLVLSSRATGEAVDFSATGTGLGTATERDRRQGREVLPRRRSRSRRAAPPTWSRTRSPASRSPSRARRRAPSASRSARRRSTRRRSRRRSGVRRRLQRRRDARPQRGEREEGRLTRRRNFDAAKGALFGDSGLTSMLSKLRVADGRGLLRPRQRGRRWTTSPTSASPAARPGASADAGQERPAADRRDEADRRDRRRQPGRPAPVRRRPRLRLRPGRRDARRRPRRARSTAACETIDKRDRRIARRPRARRDAPAAAQGEAPEGPVRGDGDGAQQRPDAAELAHRASSPRCNPSSCAPSILPGAGRSPGRPTPSHGDRNDRLRHGQPGRLQDSRAS